MSKSYLIIDDDINIRKMLSYLIKKNQLGNVLDEISTGDIAVDEILFYNPDIVIIDFLLPGMDGVDIILNAKKRGYKGKFIMISQVEDEEMRAKAYESGIYFFINKPINSIEVVNIARQVCRNIDLEQSVAVIKSAVLDIGELRKKPKEISFDEKIDYIFRDLGISSETGSDELKNVILKINKLKRKEGTSKYHLNKLYDEIALELKVDYDILINKRAIEKRIRRAIKKALQNLAQIGMDDYYNIVFAEYSSLLFDFKEVRKEMRSIKNPDSESGKISIKKFIEGIIIKLNK